MAMTAIEFYEQLLSDIQVKSDELDDAREKRDELADACKTVIREHLGPPSKHFPVGALAQGTQIAPLYDVDIVITVPSLSREWVDSPQTALNEIASWFRGHFSGDSMLSISSVDTSTHAIKIEFRDVNFTADVVIGRERNLGEGPGLWIPHCPDEDPHKWIETDPVGHRELVKKRNQDVGSEFARQVRILKWWNRYEKLNDRKERKPLSSFHVTALALEILKGRFNHAKGTADFFERAAATVRTPLKDPSGIGDDIEAKEPDYAKSRLSEAAGKTRYALTSSNPEAVLREVFGDPREHSDLLRGGAFTVGLGGILTSGSGGDRSYANPRSHGDEQ